MFITRKKNKHALLLRPTHFFCLTRVCVPRGARTLDPLIKSQLLYQLS